MRTMRFAATNVEETKRACSSAGADRSDTKMTKDRSCWRC